ncbi:DUF2203 family protein [soil metagenome]
MNTSPRNASESREQSRRPDVHLDLSTARQMLPYVQSIVTDVVDTTQKLTRMVPVQDALDDARRSLNWANRSQRYALKDDLQTAEENLAAAVSELDTLGVKLADPKSGTVDFPTRINGRPAAFTWQLGDDALRFWHYQGEEHRRPIPVDWNATGTLNRYRSEP